MDIGGITVVFAADIASLVAGVQSVVENISTLSESATVAGDLAASVETATTAVEGLATSASAISEVGASLSEVTTAASEVGTSLSDLGTEASGLGGMFAEAQAAVSDFASGVMEQMSQAGASVMEYSNNSRDALAGFGGAFQAGQKNISGFMTNLSQLGMGFFAVQGGLQMVQGAVQQATAPFGNFQEQMTQLVTGAGESEQNLALVGQGIKDMSVQVGTSTDQLTAGMYMIESAGFHGADGLKILLSAAEGAKVGAADLSTVANAVTSALNAYGLSGKDAASVTNQLIATVAAGKMHMQDLANSLAAVLPTAAAAHISFAQIGGAIATMTAQGTSAQQATQNLANTIRSLQSPNAQAVQEMQALGLNSNQVAMQLGQKGLTGTLGELVNAVLNHMGPAGTVLFSAFKNSTTAAADAKTMIAAMPKSLQGVAEAYLNGSVSSKQWSKDIAGLDPMQQHMMQQFAKLANQTDSFNQLLTKGGPASQTFTAALSKLLGGSTGLNTALQLTGSHMGTFQANVQSVSDAAKHGGSSITGWNLVQQDFNQKMAQASAQANIFWINVGEKLAPVILQLMGAMANLVAVGASVVSFFQHNQVAMDILIAVLAGVVGGILAFVATAIPALVAGFIAWAIAAGTAALATLAAAAPFIIIGLIIAAVVLGIILAVQHWGQIVPWLQGVWAAFSGWFMGVLHAIGNFFVGVWNGMLVGLKAAWNAILNAVKIGAIALLLLFTWPIVAIVALFLWLYNHNYYFKAMIDAIVGFVKTGVAWLIGAWQNTIGWIEGAWHYLSTMATMYFMMIYLTIQAKIQQVLNFVKGIIKNISDAFTIGWQYDVNLVTQLWQKISSIFSSAWNTYVATPLRNLWTSIVSFLSGWPAQMAQFGINLIKGFINGILSMIGGVGNAVGQIMGKVGAFLGFHSPSKEGPGTELNVWGPNLARGFAEGLERGIPLVQAAVTHLVQPTSALGQYPGGSNTPSSPLQGGGSNQQPIVIHLHNYMDSQEVGDVMTHTVASNIISQARASGPVGRAA